MVEGNWPHLEPVNILPDGCVDLILNLRNDIQTNHNGMVIQQERPYLVGTFMQMRVNYLQGETHLFGIRFRPGGFSCFYNHDGMHLFANQVLEFEPKLFPDLQKVIQSPITYLNQFFFQRLSPPRYALHPLIAEIHRSKGQIQIPELCKHHLITERKLERYFKQHIGYSPKAYINLTRFQNAFALIQHNTGGKSLMDIAFESGYYDHAHLANDIKRFTLATPTSIEMSYLSQTVTEDKFRASVF
jgi:AraC-like DNA-binding protein